MGCCGDKRKEWAAGTDTAKIPKREERKTRVSNPPKPNRIFENIKDNSFTIRGAATGNHYTFKYKGHRIEVDFMDSFAIMGENHLKMVTE